MEKRYLPFLQKHYLYILFSTIALLQWSCIFEDRSSCVDNQVVVVHSSINVDNFILYIFDENQNFLDSIRVKRPESTKDDPEWVWTHPLNESPHSNVTVVVWGNKTVTPHIEVGQNIKDIAITLDMVDAAAGIAASPEDIFFNQSEFAINDPQDNVHELTLYRFIASARITTYHLLEETQTKASANFTYTIGTTSRSTTLTGELFGERVSYRPESHFESGDVFVTPIFYTFPSAGEGVTVKIFKDGNLIYSVDKDALGQDLILESDKLLEVIIRLGIHLEVTMIQRDWNDQYINQEF